MVGCQGIVVRDNLSVDGSNAFWALSTSHDRQWETEAVYETTPPFGGGIPLWEINIQGKRLGR